MYGKCTVYTALSLLALQRLAEHWASGLRTSLTSLCSVLFFARLCSALRCLSSSDSQLTVLCSLGFWLLLLLHLLHLLLSFRCTVHTMLKHEHRFREAELGDRFQEPRPSIRPPPNMRTRPDLGADFERFAWLTARSVSSDSEMASRLFLYGTVVVVYLI